MPCYSGPAPRRCIEVARDPKRLGAEIGFFSVLHTWNQKLQAHPHVHCVVPAGGLAPDHSRWIDSQQKFFLPVDVLKEVFRGKFVDGLRTLHAEHKLSFYGALAVLQNPKAFAAWLRPLFRSPWVVYSKRPFGGAQHALRYLGQYTHRVAISNHRLVTLADGMVTFRWRDSAHHNKKRLMTLPINEFLRRFLLHVLPPGFVRIRYFGWMAHRRRGASLPLCLQLLAQSGRVSSEAEPAEKARLLTTAALDLSPMRRTDGPHRTAQLHGASMAVSARSRQRYSHDSIFLITTSAHLPTPSPHVCPRCLGCAAVSLVKIHLPTAS